MQTLSTPFPCFQGFAKLLGIKVAKVDDVGPEELLAQYSNPAVQAPFSTLVARKKRPYFFNRTFTGTDIGYGAFFIGMCVNASLLVNGILGFCNSNRSPNVRICRTV